jgi:FAD binding domain
MTARSLWRDAAWAGAAGWLAWDRDRERGGTMSGDLADLARRLCPGAVVTDEGVIEGYRRDRAATVPAGRPRAVVRPGTVAEVSSTLRWAARNAVPVVPRGAGTGLSGGANAIDGCLMLSLERFTAIREISTRHQYAFLAADLPFQDACLLSSSPLVAEVVRKD